MRARRLALLLPLLASVSSARAVDYATDIKPLLTRRCTSCHGPRVHESGLRLDASSLILKGGDDGVVIIPGKPDESLMYQAITGTGDATKMPAEGDPLSDAEIALIKSWIADGAKVVEEPVPPDPRDHWAFHAPKRPPVPMVQETEWIRNPIDAFVAAKHQELGLRHAPEADRRTLLRRVYLDLIGLPPTPGQAQEFLSDSSTDAYEKVVDRLLESPQYGERWGRHWMDIWRYSDWDGHGEEIRNSQRHIWRWRDWIVESLNANVPYDQMIVSMLAADEATPTDASALRATGFLARNWYKFNRDTWLESTVEHTSKAFLGLTINCARCHDHKYDPIAQTDYYQFRAFFEPYDVRTDRVPGQPDVLKDGLPRVYDANAAAPTYVYERGNVKDPRKDHPIAPVLPSVLPTMGFVIQPVELPPAAYYPGLQEYVQKEMTAAAEQELAKAETAVASATQQLANAKQALNGPLRPEMPSTVPSEKLQAQLDLSAASAEDAQKQAARANANVTWVKARITADQLKYGAAAPDEIKRTAIEAERAERDFNQRKAEAEITAARLESLKVDQSEKSADEKVKLKQPHEQKIAEATKQLDALKTQPDAAEGKYTPLTAVYPAQSTGRRLALARWIANTENPLTARVAVNHIWMRHFGSALVSSVFNFGNSGEHPTHPELLDWLAVEFAESGWDMKRLHRLLVTSSTYRMASTSSDSAQNRMKDPDNQFLWRMNARRMEAEAIRDSVLAVSGQLDFTMGGPDLDTNSATTVRRRSLYFRHANEKRVLFLNTFDSASVQECYRRAETITPQQALALANSALTLNEARRLAKSISDVVGSSPETNTPFVESAFEKILGRPVGVRELQACLEFLAQQAERFAQPQALGKIGVDESGMIPPSEDAGQRSRENLLHVLLNHHEFITIR